MEALFYIIKTISSILMVIVPLFLIVAYVTYSERKIIGFMQSRMGPMRVGPYGLLQPIADVLKLVSKEIIIRSSNSNNPTLRRCKSLLTTHDDDDFMSIPKSVKVNSESKITITEMNNNFKISTNIRLHTKPENTVLVKMNGRYKQKIGSYNTTVDLS